MHPGPFPREDMIMDKARRAEILAEMVQDTEDMYAKMDKLRKSGSRSVSLADLEQFRNEATNAMDSFRALCVAVDAHERTCIQEKKPVKAFVSPRWEPCDTNSRPSEDPVTAWDAHVYGDLWTLEFSMNMWRLWGPKGPDGYKINDLTENDIAARHLANQEIREYYETGKR